MHFLMTLAVTVILYNCRCVAIGIRGCECVTFDDTYNKEYGIFTSPNFPTPYDDNIDCLLYTFIGKSEQIVKLSFVSFDVQKGSSAASPSASSAASNDCTTGDFVKLFLNAGEGTVGINERSQYDTILCGKSLDKSQMTHFSVGHLLVFEFHSDSINANNKGFSGTFQFINKSNFVSDGDLLSGAQCDYQFVRLSIDNKKRGKLYSPNYPSYYPPNSNCAYHFFAKYNEKVKVLFETIQLSHSDLSCRYSSDVILVYDGKNSRSPLIAQLCNHVLFAQIISSGPDLYIEFKSGARKPEGNGFKASYAFQTNDYNNSQSTQTVSEITATYTTTTSKTTIATLPSTAMPVANVVQIPRTEPDESVFSKDETTESTETPYECDQWFSSDTEKNGTFTSPNFPDPYPANVHCTYHFNGRGKERVQISFTYFDLNKPPKTSRDCESADVIMVFININGQKEKIDNYCGHEPPTQIMSNGPSLTVEFKSLPTSHNGKGFRAIYRFVTNFGITSGKPDSQSVCGFILNSTEGNNGTIISPNYPGLYPRDTECHYYFHGYASERVHLTFASFDVEGVTPCTTETASDYVELSNYPTVDLEIPRHCGLKRPHVIESVGDFFRVTFKSNDKFDGTGFEAFYQFRNQDDTLTVKKMKEISGCAKCVAHLSLIMSLIVITVLFKNVFVSQQINHKLE